MPGWKRDVGSRLDALIEHTVPEVHKAVGWNSPFYGIEGTGWFLSCHCFTNYVKVTFFRGTSLDPVPPVESKQEEVRYIHIQEERVTGTILTCDSNEIVGKVHDRMPVVLEEKDEDVCLNDGRNEALPSILKPHPDEDLRVFPVSYKVSKPENDSPDLPEEVDIGEQSGLSDVGG